MCGEVGGKFDAVGNLESGIPASQDIFNFLIFPDNLIHCKLNFQKC